MEMRTSADVNLSIQSKIEKDEISNSSLALQSWIHLNCSMEKALI